MPNNVDGKRKRYDKTLSMAYSKITNKCKKPFIWWMHKILCDIAWLFRKRMGYSWYHYHLNKCIIFGFTLYGEPINKK